MKSITSLFFKPGELTSMNNPERKIISLFPFNIISLMMIRVKYTLESSCDYNKLPIKGTLRTRGFVPYIECPLFATQVWTWNPKMARIVYWLLLTQTSQLARLDDLGQPAEHASLIALTGPLFPQQTRFPTLSQKGRASFGIPNQAQSDKFPLTSR